MIVTEKYFCPVWFCSLAFEVPMRHTKSFFLLKRGNLLLLKKRKSTKARKTLKWFHSVCKSSVNYIKSRRESKHLIKQIFYFKRCYVNTNYYKVCCTHIWHKILVQSISTHFCVFIQTGHLISISNQVTGFQI